MTLTPYTTPGLTAEQVALLTLDSGKHSAGEGVHCLMEVVSLFAGEAFSDHPACVDPVLAEFGRTWNDGMASNAEREQLKRYIPLLPGTAQGWALSFKRGSMASDWAIRTHLPAWLALSPALAEHAAELRALAPITAEQQLAAALPTVKKAAAAARAAAGAAAAGAVARGAAWNAAGAAAGAAAWNARAVARGAAWSATGAAAWDAAWDAAWAAVGAAAWDAADCTAPRSSHTSPRAAAAAVLAPTVALLQTSAHELYLAMINAEPPVRVEVEGQLA